MFPIRKGEGVIIVYRRGDFWSRAPPRDEYYSIDGMGGKRLIKIPTGGNTRALFSGRERERENRSFGSFIDSPVFFLRASTCIRVYIAARLRGDELQGLVIYVAFVLCTRSKGCIRTHCCRFKW